MMMCLFRLFMRLWVSMLVLECGLMLLMVWKCLWLMWNMVMWWLLMCVVMLVLGRMLFMV